MLSEVGVNRCLSEARIVRPRGLEPLTNRVPNTSSHAVQGCVAEVILRDRVRSGLVLSQLVHRKCIQRSYKIMTRLRSLDRLLRAFISA